MRIDIYRENEQKIFDTIAHIRQNAGQELTPGRLVNLILESIEAIELQQTVEMQIRVDGDAGKGEFPRKKTSRRIRKSISWAKRF